MKVLALNGSSNAKGVTYAAMNIVGEELKKESIEMEIVHVGAKGVSGCVNCKKCRETHHCVINDKVNEIIDRIDDFDGILLGCPAHYMDVPGPFKAFLDRLLYATEHLEGHTHKVCASIAVCRRAGAINTFQQLNNYLYCSNMIIVGSQYWNVAYGWTPEEFLAQDKEGVQTMEVLGRNMAWMLKVIDATKETIPHPVITDKRTRTNFCREF